MDDFSTDPIYPLFVLLKIIAFVLIGVLIIVNEIMRRDRW